jgi:hypothetical protein
LPPAVIKISAASFLILSEAPVVNAALKISLRVFSILELFSSIKAFEIISSLVESLTLHLNLQET